MNHLRIIALTHKQFALDTIGQFHLAPENREQVLQHLKEKTGMEELMFLSTCNRIELVFTVPHYVCPGFTATVLQTLRPELEESEVKAMAAKCERYNGEESIDHLLRVASSLDSVILGEREIITQLRKSFEESAAMHLSGDSLRLVMKQCIKTSKEVFTHTDLAKKPVSAVSLAWHEFQQFGLHHNARIVLVGAGQIIRNFKKFLTENGYQHVSIANRTVANAQALLGDSIGKAMSLEDLHSFTDGFDALITCTASEEAVITPSLYAQLLQGDTHEKLVIDLALPADVDASILEMHHVKYIGMNEIQAIAQTNLAFRQQALSDCEALIAAGKKEFEKMVQQRQIELAMQAIPEAVKEIRNTALGSVFAKELEDLDEQSREVIEKIMAYMEKKYISIPMKMAREVLLNESIKN